MQPDSWPFLVGLFAVLTAAAFMFDYMYRALQRWVRPAFLARGDAEPNAARPVGPATPPLAAGPAGRCCHQWHTASVLYRQGGRMVCPTHYAGSPHQG